MKKKIITTLVTSLMIVTIISTFSVSALTIEKQISRKETIQSSVDETLKTAKNPEDYKWFIVTVLDKNDKPVRGAVAVLMIALNPGPWFTTGLTNRYGKHNFWDVPIDPGYTVSISADYVKLDGTIYSTPTIKHEEMVTGKVEITVKFEDFEVKSKNCSPLLSCLFQHPILARLLNLQ